MRSVIYGLLLTMWFVLLAVAHTYPLIHHLADQLPGGGLGDNVSFVWNFWWMREALSSQIYDFFESPLIFAPLGVPVVLHTHTALTAYVGATALAQLPVLVAQNVVIIASVALNGLSAYLLAFTVTRNRWPSILAGTLFLLAPSVAGRLMGHFNLLLVWPLILACTAFVSWWSGHSWRSAVLLGVTAGLVPYADYYYSVYFAVFAIIYAGSQLLAAHISMRRRAPSRLRTVAILCAALAFFVAAVIAVSSIDELRIGSTTISLRTPRNALTIGWLCTMLALLTTWRVIASIRLVDPRRVVEVARNLLPAALLALVIASPILLAGFQLWEAGDYVTQTASLKSSATGVDVATLFLGPPHHGMFRERVWGWYNALRIDPIESSAWLGIVLPAVLIATPRRTWQRPEFRCWICIAGVFALWALGPYLTVLGSNTGLILPGAISRLVPVVNNARIPGRAMAMVELSLVILAALSAGTWLTRRRLLFAVVTAVGVLERLASPLPLATVPTTGVYAALAKETRSGAVLTIPFGIRDGFGERGSLEHGALYDQTQHGHALVGGFIARAPRRVWEWYESTEPYATLLALSERRTITTIPQCDVVAAGLERAAVTHVVFYKADASPELSSFVYGSMPLTFVSEDSLRRLFAVVNNCPATR